MHSHDVFGRAVLAWAQGSTTPEVLERVDGFTQIGAGPEIYLSGVRDWPGAERQSLRHLRGRVLDVGCGAGRVALALQRRGLDVVGLDSSPLAARAARLRGVNEVWRTPVESLNRRLFDFDSIVLYGNNFGIFETPERARRILADLARYAKPTALMFLESTNPYTGAAPGLDRTHYHRNKRNGLAPGQVRLRFHYESFVGSWFDWIYVSRRDLRNVVRGTGWRPRLILGDELSAPYVAVLERT